MQNNRQEQDQELQTAGYQAGFTPNLTADHAIILKALSPTESGLNVISEEMAAQIEDYLDQVCAPLTTAVPHNVRREWRAEMQTHLESLTAAHIELGADPAEAVHSALRQFGEAHQVSSQWQAEWEQVGTTSTSATSLKVAYQWFGGGFGLTAFMLLLTGDLINQGRYGAHLVNLLCVLTPLVAGIAVGRSARHPVKATLAAIWRYALPLLALYVTIFTCVRGSHELQFSPVTGGYAAQIGSILSQGKEYGMIVAL